MIDSIFINNIYITIADFIEILKSQNEGTT